MGPGARLVVITIGVAAAGALLGACSSGAKSAAHAPTTRATNATRGPSDSTAPTATSSTAPLASAAPTTTTRPHTLLQALLAQGRQADIKVVYDTPAGRATLIRRNGDSVYADPSGVRFTLGSLSYDCTGAGDGATCTKIAGDATQSDVDVYTALVADALSSNKIVTMDTTSILGRTAECVEIAGRPAARAGTFVDACIDDDNGVLLRLSTLGPPNPGPKLYAVQLATPTDRDFQLPVPPSP